MLQPSALNATLREMLRFTLMVTLVFAGCAKTHLLAPGQPEGEHLVVTYYYLKF